MVLPKNLDEFKEVLTQIFERFDPDSYSNTPLKAHLIESNLSDIPNIDGYTPWENIGGCWYRCNNSDDFFILNKGTGRIWTLYSISKVPMTNDVVEKWSNNKGLDRCWFSGNYLHNYGKKNGWSERGIGIKYHNTLVSDDAGMNFSMKAWHGSDMDPNVAELINRLENKFTTASIHWKSFTDSQTSMNSEWYNNGKITIRYTDNVTEMLRSISEISEKYLASLDLAENYRDQNRSAFEFRFDTATSLDDYSESLAAGKTGLKLWMMEIEKHTDFRRFSGIDLHNGDRILLDMGEDYAYMTIPGKGCVNAAPRFLAINDENALGKVKAYYEGGEIFDGA